MQVRRRGATQFGSHPEGFENAGGQIVGERDLRPRGDVFRERLEADIRIDPSLAWPSGGRTRLERQTRRMREQMPQRRSLGPGRLVEIDGSVVGATPIKAKIRPDALTVIVPAPAP